jgi:hypothetical protein
MPWPADATVPPLTTDRLLISKSSRRVNACLNALANLPWPCPSKFPLSQFHFTVVVHPTLHGHGCTYRLVLCNRERRDKARCTCGVPPIRSLPGDGGPLPAAAAMSHGMLQPQHVVPTILSFILFRPCLDPRATINHDTFRALSYRCLFLFI